MRARIRDGRLIVTVPLHDPKPSDSGKTLLVASSRGTKRSTVLVDGKSVHINLNAFVYPDGHETAKAQTVSATRGNQRRKPNKMGKRRRKAHA